MNSNRQISSTLLFLITASALAFEGVALDYFLLQVGAQPLHLMVLSNVLMAAAAATALLMHRLRRREKQQVLADRLEALSEMNLHVRSALTSIAFYGRRDNGHGMQLVSESLGRLEDAFQGAVSMWRPIPERNTRFKRSQGDLLRNVLKFRTP